MHKTYEVTNHKKSLSSPINIKNKSNDNINIKTYTLSTSPDNYVVDEISISVEDVVKNTNYHIAYDTDTNSYHIFKFSIECNHIICRGVDNINTFDLINDSYKCIKVICDEKLNISKNDEVFGVYSKQIKETTRINVKNQFNININLNNEQIIYYPIYIVCQHNYNVDAIADVYPHLVKNIFKFNL